MNRREVIQIPEVTDDDIKWVTELLNLPENAFYGQDGNDPRSEVIKTQESLDVEACPGSGKTTLLVAKLAILANKWKESRQGICVLSHTNIARQQIENRLANTSIGEKLLSYPHFIGTIHGFINEFLAIPWLRSNNYPINIIDDDICLGRRWKILPSKTQYALSQKRQSQNILRIHDTNFSVGDIPWGRNGTLGKITDTYKNIQNACKQAIEEGYFCYDEMFVWAEELINQLPYVIKAIRQRFPLFFLDEVQDNSNIQSTLLYKLFWEGEPKIVRQRFGDSNQAIFQNSSTKEGAAIDIFPDQKLRKSIPNSYRFGSEIAKLAESLCVNNEDLIGEGPNDTIESNSNKKHTIFLFNNETIPYVLSNYANYLNDIFNENDLAQGIHTAVGGIHRGDDDLFPRHVGQYWSLYNPDLTKADPKPKSFYEYLQAGQNLSFQSNDSYNIINKIAEAILHLSKILNPNLNLSRIRRKHRYLLNLIDNEELRDTYLSLSVSLSNINHIPEETEWNDKFRVNFLDIAKHISGVSNLNEEANTFLNWNSSENSDAYQSETSKQSNNIFQYPYKDPKVHIKVGSIHSVKGETHSSTLVLETYYRTYQLKKIKPWLKGKKRGCNPSNGGDFLRLKQHFVAMTRPSHLLCIAMNQNHLSDKDIYHLKEKGWRIASVTEINVPKFI